LVDWESIRYELYRLSTNAINKAKAPPIKIDPVKIKRNAKTPPSISSPKDSPVPDYMTMLYMTIAMASLNMDSPNMIAYRS
jgi:hypothetical protein